MTREDGYYWVRLRRQEWQVAEYINGDWWFTGADFTLPESAIEEIGAKIERGTP